MDIITSCFSFPFSCLCFFSSLVLHFGVNDCRRMIFLESSPVYMGYRRTWTRHPYDMSTQFIDSSWQFMSFDNISELQNFISDSPPPPRPPPASLWRFAYENRYVTDPEIFYLFHFFKLSQFSRFNLVL